MTDFEPLELFAAAVCGEIKPWPCAGDEPTVRASLDAVRWHGLVPLVAHHLRESGDGCDWPVGLRAALDAERRGAAVIEDRSRAEVANVLAALENAGIRALVFKGTALAYMVYARPWLRPRLDTDILVAPSDRDGARRILEARGYRRTPLVDGPLVMRQAEYVREEAAGLCHAVDLHWRLGNAPVLAGLFSFDELWSRAVGVPALGTAARAPEPVDALVIACVHRVAHHEWAPQLIWLYDVYRLAGVLSQAELETFACRAVSKRVARVSAAALAETSAVFPLRLAVERERLDEIFACAAADEPSARYLQPASRRVAALLRDLGLFDTWSASALCFLQHLFPSRAYMQAAYGRSQAALLPLLYAHRLSTGVWRWLRRPDRLPMGEGDSGGRGVRVRRRRVSGAEPGELRGGAPRGRP